MSTPSNCMVIDPNGERRQEPARRVRFPTGQGRSYIEVEMCEGALLVRSDGFTGPLAIRPRISNEIEIRADWT